MGNPSYIGKLAEHLLKISNFSLTTRKMAKKSTKLGSGIQRNTKSRSEVIYTLCSYEIVQYMSEPQAKLNK